MCVVCGFERAKLWQCGAQEKKDNGHIDRRALLCPCMCESNTAIDEMIKFSNKTNGQNSLPKRMKLNNRNRKKGWPISLEICSPFACCIIKVSNFPIFMLYSTLFKSKPHHVEYLYAQISIEIIKWVCRLCVYVMDLKRGRKLKKYIHIEKRYQLLFFMT